MPHKTPAAGTDRKPVDSLVTTRPPDAIAADGEVVSTMEIEAAVELSRALRRVGLEGGRLDGFALFRAYRWLTGRRIAQRRARGSTSNA